MTAVKTNSQSLPRAPLDEVSRSHLVQTIQEMFTGDVELVLVEGDEGRGKTTILSQFVRAHSDLAIGLFVGRVSRWSYSPDVLRLDLYYQALEALGDSRDEAPAEIDEGALRAAIYRLQRRARETGVDFVFVIDGIFEIPDEDSYVREIVLDMLPFGRAGFRFLFSSRRDDTPPKQWSQVTTKSFVLPLLSRDEVRSLLSDRNPDESSLSELMGISRGHPGYVSTIKRLVDSGMLLAEILANPESAGPSPEDLEWRTLRPSDATEQMLVALVAHDRRLHTANEIATLLEVDRNDVDAICSRHSFLAISADLDVIDFVSERHRRTAQRRLNHMRQAAYDLLIRDLLKAPESEVALRALPDYLETSGRLDDLLAYLSPEHLAAMIEISQSLSSIQQRARLGVSAAERLGRDADLVRFGVHESTIVSLSSDEDWRSEVDARLSLGDFEGAATLAHRAPTKEDRLHLLAVISRKKKEDGLTPESAMLDQIEVLCKELAGQIASTRAVRIATELVSSSPTLAIRLIEDSADDDRDGSNAWKLARSSISAVLRQSITSAEETREPSLLEGLDNSEARRLAVELSIAIGGFSAAQLVAETERLDLPSERIYLLRSWIRQNPMSPEALSVADSALRLLVSSAELTVSAELLGDIASPLRKADVGEAAEDLLRSLETQRSVLSTGDLTVDRVRLDLVLAHAVAKGDLVRGADEFVAIFANVLRLDDLLLRSECLALLISEMAQVPGRVELEAREQLSAVAAEQLQTDFTQLLADTAYHHDLAIPIIRALAGRANALALELAAQLNTVGRRDAAFGQVASSAVGESIHDTDLLTVAHATRSILGTFKRSECLVDFWRRVDDRRFVIASLTDPMSQLVAAIAQIDDAEARCRAYASALASLERSETQDPDLRRVLVEKMRLAWESVGSAWARTDSAFWIARTLSHGLRSEAESYLSHAGEASATGGCGSAVGESVAMTTLRLAIRGLSGLLPRQLDTPSDISRLVDLAESVSSPADLGALLGELSTRLQLGGRLGEARRLTEEKIWPLLDRIPANEALSRFHYLRSCGVPLLESNRVLAIEKLRDLPQPYRDQALAEVARVTFERVPAGEPYSDQGTVPLSDRYGDVVMVCDLLSEIEEDAIIANLVEKLVSAILAPSNRRAFTRAQTEDIAQRLVRLASSKFPSPSFIQHDGYAIVFSAQVHRLRRGDVAGWRELIARAQAIPNRADRAFVLTRIGVLWSTASEVEREAIYRDAIREIAGIPCARDQLARRIDFASMVARSAPALAKRTLREAMSFAVSRPGASRRDDLRRLVDTAYQIDPDFSRSLMEQVDNDPARGRARREIEAKVSELRLRDAITGGNADNAKISRASDESFADASWQALAALNADLAHAGRLSESRHVAASAARLSLEHAYPAFAWVVENSVRRLGSTDQAAQQLRPLFESLVLGAELARSLVRRGADSVRSARRRVEEQKSTHSVVVGPRDREAALGFIARWLAAGSSDFVKICDPYFGPEDLELLKLIGRELPGARVEILTSRKRQEQLKIARPWEDTYRHYWRTQFLLSPPPRSEIVVAGTESNGELPIHDRWILVHDRGLRLGTSFNGLGGTKQSEISELKRDEASSLMAIVDRYLSRQERIVGDERMEYTLFSL